MSTPVLPATGRPRRGAAPSLAWRHARHWAAPPAHALARAVRVGGGVAVFVARLEAPRLAHLLDHRVGGSPVFPGAGYFEMAGAAVRALSSDGSSAAAAAAAAALSGLTIHAPLLLPDAPTAAAAAAAAEWPVLQCSVGLADGALEIASLAPAASRGGSKERHVTGAVAAASAAGAAAGGAMPLAIRAARLLAPPALTPLAGAAGAPAFAFVEQPLAARRSGDGGLAVDVGAFDSALQLGQVFIAQAGPRARASAAAGAPPAAYVPAALEAAVIVPAGGEPGRADPLGAVAAPREAAAAGAAVSSDFKIWRSGSAAALCSLSGLQAKPMALAPRQAAAGVSAGQAAAEAAAEAPPSDLIYEVEWLAQKPLPWPAAPLDGPAPSQAARLALTAAREAGAAAAAALAVLQGALLPTSSGSSSSSRRRGALVAALRLDASMERGAASSAAAAAAAAGGVLRTAARELPGAQLSTFASDRLIEPAVALSVTAATAADAAEAAPATDVFGGRASGAALLVPRLLPSAAAPPPSGPFQLRPMPRGTLDALMPVASDAAAAAAPGDVIVAVRAVGLNFRDVLNVLGMYPGDPGLPGSDFAGVVARGPGAGRAVFGLTTGALASHTAASPLTVAPLPPHVSFEDGAAAPTVQVTVHAALRQIAGLAPGERLLLPAAAGGVGLAAVGAAAVVGASVLGTAGSPGKRALLRSLGGSVTAVAGSRDAAFATDLATTTLGAGADVVLNALTSPGMVAASLALLRRGGRLVEIGKRDVWSGAAVAAARPDVSYSFLAVDFLPPPILHSMLMRLSSDMAAGAVTPLPGAVHDLRAAAAALRQLSQARHVGKVVVSAGTGAKGAGILGCGSSGGVSSGEPGAVLVTGGTGALGSLVAAWLAGGGARHIVLAGRGGRAASTGALPLTDPASPLFSASVTLVASDTAVAADAAALAAALSAGGNSAPPLAALMHAAGVLTDAALANQTAAAARRAAAPKAAALAQLRRRLLAAAPAAQTLLFSSVASLLGSAGQASYSAANAALDTEAAALSFAGLPARSVQFGAWAGAGMAAATASKADAMGAGALSPEAGLAALEAALSAQSAARWGLKAPAVLAASPFNWRRLLAGGGADSRPPSQLFAEFAGDALAKGSGASANAGAAATSSISISSPAGRLAALPTESRRAALSSAVDAVVSGLVGRAVAPDEPLMAAGLDSLGAVELRSSLETRLGLSLPATLVFDYPSSAALVGALDSMVAATAAAQEGPAGGAAVVAVGHAAAPPAATPRSVAPPAAGRPLILVSATAQRLPRSATASSGGGWALADAIRVVPLARWDVEEALTEQRPARFGGFVDGAEVSAEEGVGGLCLAVGRGGTGCLLSVAACATPSLTLFFCTFLSAQQPLSPHTGL